MRKLVPLLAAAFAVAALPAQQPTPPTTAAAAAWSDFTARRGAQWNAEWLPATGTPLDVWGPGLRLQSAAIADVATARAHAEAVLEQFATLLGRGETTFVEDIQAKNRQVWTFGFQQHYKGLPCITGRANVMIHDVGVLAMFGSTALPVPAGMSTAPGIAQGQARVTAHAHAGVEPPSGPVRAVGGNAGCRLVVWGDAWAKAPTPVRLAWEVKVQDLPSGTVGRVYVDAQDGTVLQWVDEVHSCGFEGCSDSLEGLRRDAAAAPELSASHGAPIPGLINITGNVMGWVNNSIEPGTTATLVNLPLENILVSVAGGGSAFTDSAGNFTIQHSGTAPVTLDVTLTGRHVGQITTVQGATVSWSMPVTPGTPVNVQLSSPTPTDVEAAQMNAYWCTDHINQFAQSRGAFTGSLLDGITVRTTDSCLCNAFFGNLGTSYRMRFCTTGTRMRCPNTAYPSLIYHEWGHGLDTANGGSTGNEGMSEGSSDFLSIAVLGDPIVGKDLYGPGMHLRTALNTRQFPSGGNVYEQGETWMGWGWDVYVNLQQTLGQAAALNTFRDFAVGFFAANPGTQASGVRAVFVLDDDDGDLTNGTPNCNALAQACTKRNLPNPATCFGTPVYNLYGTGCTGSPGTPPLLTNSGAPIIGTAMDVLLTQAAPTSAVALLIGGSKTQWVGLPLPFDLSVLRAPGCSLLASGEATVALVSDASGAATFTANVPNSSSLVNGWFFNQFVVFDAAANGLGMAFSNAGEGRVGLP